MLRILPFYVVHTFLNSLKKLFKTWVAVWLAVCLLFGAGVGILVAVVGDRLDGDQPAPPQQSEETQLTPQQEAEAHARSMQLLEMAVGGALTVWLLISLYLSDKSSMKIFQMADVNLLFTAPMKPQAVLLFKVILQMGLALVSTIYLLFQLPNLVMNLGLSMPTALSLLLCWMVVLILGKLVSVWAYTLTNTHPALRRYVAPVVYGIAGALGGVYLAYYFIGGKNWFDAAAALLAAPWGRWIPVVGWLRGMVVYMAQEQYLRSALCFAGIAAACALFVWAIWRMKADFYEDALEAAQTTQQQLEAALAGRQQRTKERSSKIARNGELAGAGAVVFLTKAWYNRKRFSRLGYFSKTCQFYLLLNVGGAAVLRFVVPGGGSPLFLMAGLLLVVFFRNSGNPIELETGRNFLWLVPESGAKKLGYALLAGTMDCVLDLLPGWVIACVLLRIPLAQALLWPLLLVTLDWFASCCGLFIEMIFPLQVVQNIRAMFQFMLRMIIATILGGVLAACCIGLSVPAGAAIVAAANVVIGGGLYLFAASRLHEGR